jgi:hypothetical protein
MTRTGWNNRLWRLGIAALSIAATLSTAAPRAFADGAQQATFSTPEQAVNALVAANRSGSTAELLKILGPESDPLISSGDPIADKAGRNRFVAAYDVSHKLESRGTQSAVLIVGKEGWPFPIPIVRKGTAWHFDTKAGATKVLERRIGRNELTVIEVCRAYVEAQREYAAEIRSRGRRAEYARHLASASDKHDGLYWPTRAGEEQSPFGPLIAKARAAGYFAKDNQSTPFFGYYYKILTRQGPNAPGGARNYVVNGQMTGGFAMLAFPAKYGNSGIMTFIVNQDGIVYQKDLGPETESIAANITQFDPDATWKTP